MSTQTPPTGTPPPKSALKRFLPLIVLIGAIGAFYASGAGSYLSLEALANNRASLAGFVASNYVSAVLLFIALYACAVAMSLPGGALLTITSGFLFGQIAGGLVAIVAATIGATLLFFIAKSALGDALAKRAGPFLAKLREGFAEDAFNYLLFLRLVPAFPFWLVNLAPAFLGVPLRTYVMATAIGIVPGTFAFAFLGAGLDSIITAQRESYEACLRSAAETCTFSLNAGQLITGELIIAFVALGVVALIPPLVKKWRAARTPGR